MIAAVRREAALAGLRPLALSRQPVPPPDSPILVAVVRNERDRLPDFLRHYREAGIRRFCVIDNMSTDGSQDLLAAQPDLDLLLTERVYGNPERQGWIVAALARYGGDRWIVTADADELIVFDGIETHGFGALAREMDARGIRRVRGFMLDMYAEGPLLRSRYRPGDRLLDAYPFHDATGYAEREEEWAIAIRGGPRQRIFGEADPAFAPNLAKVPMLRLGGHEVPSHAHFAWPVADNFSAPRLLALLHFKFLPDFVAKVQDAVERGVYWRGSATYRVYQQVCARQPGLVMMGPESRRYAGSRNLVEGGLIQAVGWGGAPVRPLPADGAVSRFAVTHLRGGEARLLDHALDGASDVCGLGLGPEALLALRRGARLVALDGDAAALAALAQRQVALKAAREGRLTLIESDGAPGLAAVWRAWRDAGAWPSLVVAAGRHRVLAVLDTLREAAARGIPPDRVAILIIGHGPARPWYAPALLFTRAVAQAGALTLLRPHGGTDAEALAAALAAHAEDPR